MNQTSGRYWLLGLVRAGWVVPPTRFFMVLGLKTITQIGLGILLIFSLDQCRQQPSPIPDSTTPTRDDNIAMGNPDGAKASESSPNAYLIPISTYSLSYN